MRDSKEKSIGSLLSSSDKFHSNAFGLIGAQIAAQAKGSYSFESETLLGYRRDVEIATERESYLRQLSVRALIELAIGYLNADITLSDSTVVQPDIIDRLTPAQLLEYLSLLATELGIAPITVTAALSVEALAALLVGYLSVRINYQAERHSEESDYESDVRGRLKHSLKIKWSFSESVEEDAEPAPHSCHKKRKNRQ